MITHAGAVVFRKNRDRTLYLIVSSSDGAHWVLPKGHIEPGESPEMAVLRELKEEAGVIGEIIGRLSLQRFEKYEEEVIAQYFLVREIESTKALEKRLIRWEDERSALRLLSFEDAREIFQKALEQQRRLEQG